MHLRASSLLHPCWNISLSAGATSTVFHSSLLRRFATPKCSILLLTSYILLRFLAGAMSRRGAEHIGTRQTRDKSVIETLSAPVLEEIRRSGYEVIRSFGHLVIWSFGQNRFSKCQNPPLYINIFIYSEQMTESENENDQMTKWPNDHFDTVSEMSFEWIK